MDGGLRTGNRRRHCRPLHTIELAEQLRARHTRSRIFAVLWASMLRFAGAGAAVPAGAPPVVILFGIAAQRLRRGDAG